MKQFLMIKSALAISLMVFSHMSIAAYISGSTGTDGAFNPVTSQAVELPPNGVFNFTSVNIPAGVTIKFKKNASNTPVTILASGDVTIAGIIDVSATPPLDPNDISGPGIAGPGGFNGGRGGQAGGDASNWVAGFTGPNIGQVGKGPGGGLPGRVYKPGGFFGGNSIEIGPGGGGAFGTSPNGPGGACPAYPGTAYGNINQMPLVGGSGGGGGVGGSVLPGSGGGGGGGAILIAATNIINVTGSILANGGAPTSINTNGRGTQGGGGSGGAIRLIATIISGNGAISALGGNYSGEMVGQSVGTSYVVCSSVYSNNSHQGGAGRIRLESETLTRTAATSPLYVGGAPSVTFIPGLPTLSIASVAGVAVPANPTGNGDVAIPANAPNPVTVVLATKGVTVGSTIKLTVLPASGVAISATSQPTTGTIDNATASVDISIPGGSSSLQASVTYTVVASLGIDMSRFAQGEQVEKVRLNSTLGGASTATLITVSGKEFTVPASVLSGLQG